MIGLLIPIIKVVKMQVFSDRRKGIEPGLKAKQSRLEPDLNHFQDV